MIGNNFHVSNRSYEKLIEKRWCFK